MKENKSRKMKRKEIDEIIKMSVDMDIPDVKDEISDEEVLAMGYSLAPDDMLDRIKKGIAEKEEAKNADAKVYSFRKVGKKAAIVFAVFALIIALGVAVHGVMVYVFNVRSNITEDAIEFRGTSDYSYSYDAEESQAYEDADKALGATTLKPTYLPEGFNFDHVKIYSNTRVAFIYKNGNETIRLNQYLIDDGMTIGVAINSENGSSYTIQGHGTKISIGEHKRLETDSIWLSAIWDDESLLYKIEGNCSKEEFEKFILNLK